MRSLFYLAIESLVLLCVASGNCLGVDFSVAAMFSDQMVFQRDQPVPIWGWAEPGAAVSVEFHGQKKTAVTGASERWQVWLDPLQSLSTGEMLTVVCRGESRVFTDIVVGEVWFAAGQSNMAFTMGAMAKQLPEGRAMLSGATFPLIRVRRVLGNDQPRPLKDLADGQSWEVCTPEAVKRHSAVAHVFARQLHQELDMPIGVIDCSWGGKPIEPFIPIEEMTGHPTLVRLAALSRTEDAEAARRMPGGTFVRSSAWYAGRIYNARVAPVVPYAIRGAIWYQGESNCGVGEDPRDYSHKMRALIRGWRNAWNKHEMPFYYVQLPRWKNYAWTWLREQQQRVLDLPNTGMAVTIDLDNHDNIHPPNKIDVGQRLARWPLARQYGRDMVVSGPKFKGADFRDNIAIVRFEHAGSGLVAGSQIGVGRFEAVAGTRLNGFELMGADHLWYEAEAEIRGGTVVVTSSQVATALAVRYACHPDAATEQPWNLYNRSWLPAAPFCSDWTQMPYDPAANVQPD